MPGKYYLSIMYGMNSGKFCTEECYRTNILVKCKPNFFCDNNINSKELVGRFNSCIDYAIKDIFKQKTDRGKHNTFPINEWYDEECKEHKSRLRHLSKYPLGTSEYDKFWTLKKQYRALTQKKKRFYQANMANQVEKMSLKNPTEYWNFGRKII